MPACVQEEEIRPASPKYDERSFFYTTPKLNPARPALQRPVTPWATPDAAPRPPAVEAVPCTLRTPAAAVPPSPQWADRCACMPYQRALLDTPQWLEDLSVLMQSSQAVRPVLVLLWQPRSSSSVVAGWHRGHPQTHGFRLQQ